MLSKRSLSSKLTIVLLLVLLGFFTNIKFRQWQKQRDIDREKQKLVSQQKALQQKNDELNQSLSYLNSPSFKERVAREQLGLKKEGEQVYNFSGSFKPADDSQNKAPAGNKSNPQKWWDYFMGND